MILDYVSTDCAGASAGIWTHRSAPAAEAQLLGHVHALGSLAAVVDDVTAERHLVTLASAGKLVGRSVSQAGDHETDRETRQTDGILVRQTGRLVSRTGDSSDRRETREADRETRQSDGRLVSQAGDSSVKLEYS